jgi:hypothetical protein
MNITAAVVHNELMRQIGDLICDYEEAGERNEVTRQNIIAAQILALRNFASRIEDEQAASMADAALGRYYDSRRKAA